MYVVATMKLSLLLGCSPLTLSLLLGGTPPPHRACSSVSMAGSYYSQPWMSELGRATNSKKKWVEPMDPDTLAPGSVVMANPGSFDHYFLESLVLVLEHSESEGTRGVLLNHETPWQVHDMSPGAIEPFAANTVFLGGDAGRDSMLMVHGESMLPGAKEIGRGVYQGGVESAVLAVEEGALPADRFKFFYKSVEWLPGALPMQITSGIFRLVELSPGFLYAPHSPRAIWREVREKLGEEDEDEAAAEGTTADVAAGLVSGALAPGEASGLPYEKGGLADEAIRKASEMREKRDKESAATEEVKKEEARMSETARMSHDEKLKAFVEEIKREKRVKEQMEAAAVGAIAPRADAPPAAEVAPVQTAGTDPFAAAAQAKAWLAGRGINSPRATSATPLAAKEEAAVAATEGAGADPVEEAEEAKEAEEAEEAEEAKKAEEAKGAEGGVEETSAAGIQQLLEYRVQFGNEQWRVRWADSAGETWETWRVLDTDDLRRRAEQLRAAAAA